MRPPFDQQTAAAMERLRNSPDYRLYLQFLERQVLPQIQQALVNAPVTEVPKLQGRALQVMDTIKY